MVRSRMALLALVLPLAARAAPSVLDPERLPESLAPIVAKADAAAGTLQKKLAGRLVEVMKQGGPAAAVTVCRDEAAKLTLEAASESGVNVGRTSDRLRNPKNAAPSWAAASVAAASGKKAAEVRRVVVDLGDRVGVLRPIPVAQACTNCHGPPDGIPPEVKRTLAAAYPDDRATGYAEGDHRGFVWAVVKK